MLAAFRFEVFKFSSLHLYEKCPLKTFCGLQNILKVSKTSRLRLQTRPTSTAKDLPQCTPKPIPRVKVTMCPVRCFPSGDDGSRHPDGYDVSRQVTMFLVPVRFPVRYSSDAERKGQNLKSFTVICLKMAQARARISPWLSNLCRIRSTSV